MKKNFIFGLAMTLIIIISSYTSVSAGHMDDRSHMNGHSHTDDRSHMDGRSDYDGHWAEKQIKEFLSKGFIKGYPDGSFKPDHEITRAEFFALTNRVCGFDAASSDKKFDDVPQGSWFEAEIYKAVKAGYVSDYGDGTIKPNDTVNRVEASKILSFILKWDDGTNSERDFPYRDTDAVPDWGRSAFYSALIQGYFKSSTDNWVQPYRNLTRAEAVVLLYKAKGGDIDESLIPASSAEQEIKGVLFTACCKEKSPEKETKACLSMADCAASGYGVKVKRHDGSYTFLPFDSHGNELAKRDILAKTEKNANITIAVRAVEGCYPGGILKVLSIEEDNTEATAQAEQTLEGVLIDKHCFAFGEPETDSVECLRMKTCEESGYGIAVKQSDGTYRFYKFDELGQSIAKTILRNTLKENNIVVVAKGIVEGETIKISELKEK